MEKPKYRFYRGEKTNPFDDEKDPSRSMFWRMEGAFDKMAEGLDASQFYQGAKGYVPDFVKKWRASDLDKGLLVWMILQSARWCPYDAKEVDWELYTK